MHDQIQNEIKIRFAQLPVSEKCRREESDTAVYILHLQSFGNVLRLLRNTVMLGGGGGVNLSTELSE